MWGEYVNKAGNHAIDPSNVQRVAPTNWLLLLHLITIESLNDEKFSHQNKQSVLWLARCQYL